MSQNSYCSPILQITAGMPYNFKLIGPYDKPIVNSVMLYFPFRR